MVLIMEGVVETTSLIASIKGVLLRGDPWGMPLSWEWMNERWLPIRTLSDRFSKKLRIRRGRGTVSLVVCTALQICISTPWGRHFLDPKIWNEV